MVAARTTTGCCVVGGGPAGVMLGLLLARAGVEVTVLEKHADFLRDFRGDTVHASTLTLLDELGLGAAFDQLPARRIERMTAVFDGGEVEIGNLRHLPGPRKYIALVPQWDLLDFLVDASRREAGYGLETGAEVVDLLRDGDRVCGVRYRQGGVERELSARLVVGCDGRDSVVRERAGLRVREFGTPMDIWWFRLPRRASDPANALGRVSAGSVMVLIDRGDYFQIGYGIPKGSDAVLRTAGVAAFRARVAALVPWLADRVDALESLADVRLLNVRLSRQRRWSADGVLCLGDAAHAMSPVGGVGINLAIQDAVATARLLAEPLRSGVPTARDLRRVARRRWLPTALTQGAQRLAHRNFRFEPRPSAGARELPRVLRWWRRVPALHVIPGYLVAVGLRPEHAPRWARRPNAAPWVPASTAPPR